MDELNAYIREYKPLIIGIAEVKPKHHRYAPNVAAYNIDNYVTFHKKCKQRYR